MAAPESASSAYPQPQRLPPARPPPPGHSAYLQLLPGGHVHGREDAVPHKALYKLLLLLPRELCEKLAQGSLLEDLHQLPRLSCRQETGEGPRETRRDSPGRVASCGGSSVVPTPWSSQIKWAATSCSQDDQGQSLPRHSRYFSGE